MAIRGLRSLNLHNDQTDVAAGWLDMIVFTVNPDFNTHDKVVCVSNKYVYIHEIILRPTQNCCATQIYVATRWLSNTYTNEQSLGI
jgi:ribosomal protein S2